MFRIVVPDGNVTSELPDSLGFTKVTAELAGPLPETKRYGIWLMIGGMWVDVGQMVDKAVICDHNSAFGGSVLGTAVGKSFDDRTTTDPGGAVRIHSTVDQEGELWLGAVKQRRPTTLITPLSTSEDIPSLRTAIADPEKGFVYNAARGYAKVHRGIISEKPDVTAEREAKEETGLPTESQFDLKPGTEVIFGGTTNNANIVTSVYTVVAIARHLPFTIFVKEGDFIVPSPEWLESDTDAQLAEEIKGVSFRPWYQWTTASLVTDYLTAGSFFAYLSLLRREGLMQAGFH